MSRGRRQYEQELYQNAQEDFEARRNSGRVRYDESQFGSSIFDVDNPLEYDAETRKAAFEDMGSALRQDLLQRRGLPPDQRIHVESRSPSAPQTVQEARKAVLQATRQQNRARTLSNEELFDQQGRYYEPGDEDDYDEQESVYDDGRYHAPRRYNSSPAIRDRYADLEPDVEQEYDEDDEPEEWTPPPPRRQQRSAPRPTRSNAPVPSYPQRSARSVRPESREDVRQPQQRTGRSAAIPPPAQRRALPPAGAEPRRRNAGPPADPQRLRVRPQSPVEERRDGRGNGVVRTGDVRPSRPEFLGPDGRIPRNACGSPLYITIGGVQVIIECQEERRGSAPPWHVNMPHIARVVDPMTNADNACVVWYYRDEAPK